MRCPKCSSSNTQFIVDNRSSGPSFSWGCCGAIFLGPLGILCSLCGVSNSHKEYWICKKCGTKFDENCSLEAKIDKQINELNNEIRNLNNDIDELKRNMKNIYTADTTYEAEREKLNEKEKHYTIIKKDLLSKSKELQKIDIICKSSLVSMIIIPIFLFILFESVLITGISFVGLLVVWARFDELFKKKAAEVDSKQYEKLNVISSEKEVIQDKINKIRMEGELAKKKERIIKAQSQLNEANKQKETMNAE